jgi:uncharacterized protein (TIGR02466 family)
MENSLTIPIFPEAVLHICRVNVDKNEMLNYIKNNNFIKNENGHNCYMSSNTYVLNDLSNLKNEIQKHVNHYLKNILQYKMNFKFVKSWLTKTEPEGHSSEHRHANSFLSGVYYPESGKDFNICFYKKDNFWDVKSENFNDFNARNYRLNISEDNFLILFPSDLKHGIAVNNSNADRYSIAFNINPSGYIGSGDSRIFF